MNVLRALRALLLLLVLVPAAGAAAPCCAAPPADGCCAPESACPVDAAGDCVLTTGDAPALPAFSIVSAPPVTDVVAVVPDAGLAPPLASRIAPGRFAADRAGPSRAAPFPLRL